MALAIANDSVLTHNLFFSILILVSNKVVSSYNEAHIFLYQES